MSSVVQADIFTASIVNALSLDHDSVSERLRRWTRNPLGSARRGSNPLAVVSQCYRGSTTFKTERTDPLRIGALKGFQASEVSGRACMHCAAHALPFGLRGLLICCTARPSFLDLDFKDEFTEESR